MRAAVWICLGLLCAVVLVRLLASDLTLSRLLLTGLFLMPWMILLPGLWRDRSRAYQWASLWALPYLALGIVDWAAPPPDAWALVQSLAALGLAFAAAYRSRYNPRAASP